MPKNIIYSKMPVNPSQFLNVQTPEVAYILGLLWADGYILYKEKTKTSQSRKRISLTLIKEDADKIKDIFLKTGNWKIIERTPNPTDGIIRKTVLRIETNNEIIAKFLSENDYVSKSNASACKILSKIPDNLKHYWFRGLVDGDGCIYLNPDGKHFKLSICSSYAQDWTYLSNLFNLNNWKYKSIQSTYKNNKYSKFQVTSRQSIIDFCNYIYAGYKQDKIGLDRKYQKFLLIPRQEKFKNQQTASQRT